MRVVDPYSPTNRFRSARFLLLKRIVDQLVKEKGACKILDIGGTADYWAAFGSDLDWSKLTVHLVNLEKPPSNNERILSSAGDARNLPQFQDMEFDVVHSNSVIEHVGRWADMVMMANEVRRLAPCYFVQTPYFWFPIEPHARFPFFHWMPESWRYRIMMMRTCGYWGKQSTVGGAVSAIQSAVLIDKKQMQYLFPDGDIVSERILGVTKSLIAIRGRRD